MTQGLPSTRWCTPSGRWEFSPQHLGERPDASVLGRARLRKEGAALPGLTSLNFPRPSIDPASLADAMLAGLRKNIQRGYWKVAIRRYLMMRVCGLPVPDSDTQQCYHYIARCPAGDLVQIEHWVVDWAKMIAADQTLSNDSIRRIETIGSAIRQ